MMLFYKYFCLLFLLLGIVACGDDTPDCTQMTIPGRYEGTLSCMTNGTNQSDQYAFDISSNGSTQLNITDIFGSTTVEWNGCDLSLPEVSVENNFGIISTTQITGIFSENMVQFTRTTTTDGQIVTCTFTGIK